MTSSVIIHANELQIGIPLVPFTKRCWVDGELFGAVLMLSPILPMERDPALKAVSLVPALH